MIYVQTEANRALKKADLPHPYFQRIRDFLKVNCVMYEAEISSAFANR
jgi:hypothetical protein